MRYSQSLENLKKDMITENINPVDGLPLDMFLFSTTLSPVINVDLLITNTKKEVLLVWRDDKHNGVGWHIPGGCIRFKETIDERIHKCAKNEIGCDVFYEPDVVAVIQHIITDYRNISNQNERAHFISLAYKCFLENEIELGTNYCWFSELPQNLLATQGAYREQWNEIKNKLFY